MKPQKKQPRYFGNQLGMLPLVEKFVSKNYPRLDPIAFARDEAVRLIDLAENPQNLDMHIRHGNGVLSRLFKNHPDATLAILTFIRYQLAGTSGKIRAYIRRNPGAVTLLDKAIADNVVGPEIEATRAVRAVREALCAEDESLFVTEDPARKEQFRTGKTAFAIAAKKASLPQNVAAAIAPPYDFPLSSNPITPPVELDYSI